MATEWLTRWLLNERIRGKGIYLAHDRVKCAQLDDTTVLQSHNHKSIKDKKHKSIKDKLTFSLLGLSS